VTEDLDGSAPIAGRPRSRRDAQTPRAAPAPERRDPAGIAVASAATVDTRPRRCLRNGDDAGRLPRGRNRHGWTSRVEGLEDHPPLVVVSYLAADQIHPAPGRAERGKED